MKPYPKLTNAEVQQLDSGKCPDCGSPSFFIGPRGGMNTNVRCANDKCRSKFNLILGMHGAFGKERISEKSPAAIAILDQVFKPID